MDIRVACFLLSSWSGLAVATAATQTHHDDNIADDVGANKDDLLDLDVWWETVGETDDIGIQGIWDRLSCNEVIAGTESPIIDESTWLLLRGLFVGIMGPYPTHSAIELETGHGIQVPYEVKISPGRGRGIFATEPISKGQIVYDDEFMACIEVDEDKDRDELDVGRLYRRFLVSSPRELVCDLIDWTFTFRNGICLSLDDTNFFNHGNSADEQNLRPFSATRDVAAGEELVEDYSEYSGGDHEVGYEKFGLGKFDEGDFCDQFWEGEPEKDL